MVAYSPSWLNGDVPSPEIVAAWTQLGLLPTEKIPLWAAHWLVAGHDGEQLVQLAGLHGDDPHDVRDVLHDALLDCGVEVPLSEADAAMLVFAHFAHMYIAGRVDAQWVCQQVEQIVIEVDHRGSIRDLPLGTLYGLDDEFQGGWNRSPEQLAQAVRDACEEQLHDGSART